MTKVIIDVGTILCQVHNVKPLRRVSLLLPDLPRQTKTVWKGAGMDEHNRLWARDGGGTLSAHVTTNRADRQRSQAASPHRRHAGLSIRVHVETRAGRAARCRGTGYHRAPGRNGITGHLGWRTSQAKLRHLSDPGPRAPGARRR